MKKLLGLFAIAALFSCSKKDLVDTKSAANYQLRIAAVDNDGTKTYSPVSRVKSGKVAVEFETAESLNVKEYNVEVSTDGSSFKSVKTIALDVKSPNKVYSDTLVLQ